MSIGRAYQEILNQKIFAHSQSQRLSLAIDFVNNNSQVVLGKAAKNLAEDSLESGYHVTDATEDMDCMVVAILSWGHSTISKLPRNNINYIRSEAARARVPMNPMAVQGAIRDFSISLSEHPLRFNNHHFWLSSSDAAWHRPMQMYMRVLGSPKSKKTIESARIAWEAKNRTPFDPLRFNSPRDEDVGYRRRPIDMTFIHYLETESQGRPRVYSLGWIPPPRTPLRTEASASSNRGQPSAGSSSSSSTQQGPDAWYYTFKHLKGLKKLSPEEQAAYCEFASRFGDDPAFTGTFDMDTDD